MSFVMEGNMFKARVRVLGGEASCEHSPIIAAQEEEPESSSPESRVDTTARSSRDPAPVSVPERAMVGENLDGEPEEGQEAKGRAHPTGPSEAERRRHELTHLPTRSWCSACTRGKSRSNQHRKVSIEEKRDRTPLIQMDYLYPEGQSGPAGLSIYDCAPGYCAALSVEHKGPSDAFASKFVLQFLKEVGHAEVQLQADPEHALTAMLNQALKGYWGRGRVRSTPRDSSGSNGSVERMHRTLYETMRALKVQLEDGWVQCRHLVLESGRTGWENVAGTQYSGDLCCFGEAVEGHLHRDEAKPVDIQWVSGVWVGKTSQSEEHIVITPTKVLLTRSARRRSRERAKMWDEQLMFSTSATPWHSRPAVASGGSEMEQALPRVLPQNMPKARTPAGWAHHSFLEEAGPTPGCGACSGRRGFHHTTECVRRRETWQQAREHSTEGEKERGTEAEQQPTEETPGSADPMETGELSGEHNSCQAQGAQ
eukprot:6461411-Amphidinium_carterae.2